MRTYQLQDFATPISVAVTNPSQSGYSRFVGLEHYDSGELVVKRYSGTELLTTTAKAFETNDILIARRNVYLKRAGIVFFDGITSGDTIVLRIKNDCESTTGVPKDLAQRIIPIVLNSEHFWIYANKHADGMNSKRISKEMLLTYEFELPSLEEQRVLADKLWAAYEVKESYKNLLVQTDKLLHAQFEKMFGDVENRPLHEACDIVMGSSPDSSTYNNERNGLPFYQGKTEFGEMYVDNPTIYCSQPIREAKQNDILMSVRAPVGAVNFAIDHCCIGRGLCSIRAKEDTTEQLFVFYALKIQENEIERLGTGSTIKCINKEQVYKIPIPKCDKNTQHEFVRIAEQAEQTKTSLNKGIEAIEAVIRSLIAEGTTKV